MGSWPNNCCCDQCNDGAVIDRWLNNTTVRKSASCADPTIDTAAAPFGREADTTEYKVCGGGGLQPYEVPADHLNGWLRPGDFNGFPTQITNADDINACAEDDATHVKLDHNCYEKSGTVDMGHRRRGGQWVNAQKFWHGIFGLDNRDGIHVITGGSCTTGRLDAGGGVFTYTYADDSSVWPSPPQTKFLKASYTFDREFYYFADGGQWGNYTSEGYVNSQVASKTGIITRGGGYSDSAFNVMDGNMPIYLDLLNQGRNAAVGFIVGKFTDTTNFPAPLPDARVTNPEPDVYELWTGEYGSGPSPDRLYRRLAFGSGSGSVSFIEHDLTFTPEWGLDTWTLSMSNSQVSLNRVYHQPELDPYPGYGTHEEMNAAITLESPYTSAQCYEDFLAALKSWNMSDLNLAKLREDEKLALAPLIIYDEVGPTEPPLDFANLTIPDYSLPQVDGEWQTRSWIDPNDYIWRSPTGAYHNGELSVGDMEGSTLMTPIRTGQIISHSQAGSGRHFWFNYAKLKRVMFDAGGADRWMWFSDVNGALSESPLPEVTLRWMDNATAQYDGMSFRNNIDDDYSGNRPQAWLHQFGGVLWGGKYIEAVEKWPSVNYCRPCGSDKYSVDQSTVCCVISNAVFGTFLVKPTYNATPPAAGDFILVENGGIAEVDTSTNNMDGSWTIVIVGAAYIDTLPSGVSCTPYEMEGQLWTDGEVHLGKLRFSNYTQNSITRASPPGLCGRVAVTVDWANAGANGVTLTVAAQKFLRKDIAGHIYVDLYDADMANKASVELTRVSDTSFTFTYATDAIESRVWMVGRDVNYLHHSATRQQTGVVIGWNFDLRSTFKDMADQPNWLGGSGAGTGTGLSGVLAQGVEKFTYTEDNCPAFIGIVPFYSDVPNPSGIPNPSGQPTANPVEYFGEHQRLFAMPGVFQFDDTYGAHWQAVVETVMPDPFWQAPYKPDCGISSVNPVDWEAMVFKAIGEMVMDSNGNVQQVSTAGYTGATAPSWATSSGTTSDGSVVWDFVGLVGGSADYMFWRQDDGSGQMDTEEERESSVIYRNFYPHPAWVEADTTPKSGQALPDGMSLFYGAGEIITPPYYYRGIPIGDTSGGYASVERPWGFVNRACAAGRFNAFYNSFTTC